MILKLGQTCSAIILSNTETSEYFNLPITQLRKIVTYHQSD